MTQREYFKIGSGVPRGAPEFVMSQSQLKTFAKDPWSWKGGREVEETDAMRYGSLVDILLLTPEEFDEHYRIRPETYPSPTKSNPDAQKPWNANSTWCKQWIAKAANDGVAAANRRDLSKAKRAIASIREHEVVSELLEDCDSQVVCQWEWKDPRTGLVIPLKCMIDLAPRSGSFITDFKTSRDCSITGFRKTASRLRYDLQGAFYLWGFRECYRDVSDFAFVVSETEAPPYPCTAYYLTPNDLANGTYGGGDRWGRREGYQQMLLRYAWCVGTGTFPELNGGDLVPLNLYRS